MAPSDKVAAHGHAAGHGHAEPTHADQAAKPSAPAHIAPAAKEVDPKLNAAASHEADRGHGKADPNHEKEDDPGQGAGAPGITGQEKSIQPKIHAADREESRGDGNDAESNTPQVAPKPDTAFARAADWEKGTAEVLSYVLSLRGKTGPIQCQGRIVTERMFLRADGSADRKPGGKGDKLDKEILNTVISLSGDDGGQPFAVQTVVKMPRKEHLRLLRQDQSLQSWPGATYRFLDCGVTPPRLRVVSSGGETVRDTLIDRWPVYTEEMLFTYLRSVPQRAGYREEVWFQDWGAEGRFAIRPQFATLSVRSKTRAVRDMETWYMTVDREDGRRSEFWVSAAGLHPVVLAVLADRSTWTLQEINRRKYWSW